MPSSISWPDRLKVRWLLSVAFVQHCNIVNSSTTSPQLRKFTFQKFKRIERALGESICNGQLGVSTTAPHHCPAPPALPALHRHHRTNRPGNDRISAESITRLQKEITVDLGDSNDILSGQLYIILCAGFADQGVGWSRSNSLRIVRFDRFYKLTLVGGGVSSISAVTISAREPAVSRMAAHHNLLSAQLNTIVIQCISISFTG